MQKSMLAVLVATGLMSGAGVAHADTEADYKSYLAIQRAFDCTVDDGGLLASGDSQSPAARVYVETGGIGVIILADLAVDGAGARYRFGSSLNVYSGVAELDVSGGTRETTGRLSSGSSWPYVTGELSLQRGYPGHLNGWLKNSSGDQWSLYCVES